MKLIRLAIHTLSWLFCLTVFAHAGPLAAAVGLIVKAFSFAGLFKALIGIAINVGISLLQRARAKKEQEKLARENSGVQVQLQGGGAVPLTIPFGETATAGNLEYVGVWGSSGKTPNAYLHMVISLADVPINALTGIIVNGERRTIGGTAYTVGGEVVGYPVSGFSRSGTNFLWVHFYDGTQTAADPMMMTRFLGNSRPWTSNHIGRGIPYVIVTARYDDKIFSSGVPQIIFEIQGAKFYDISKDSTMGGSGSHRWNTPSTWTYSNNAIVVAYNVIRGIYYGSQWLYGGQNMAAALLPSANWIAAIAEANRAMPLGASAGGGTEPQFRCGGTIEVDVQPLETIRNLLVASNSRMTELGGRFKVLCGAPGAAAATITDESIVVTEGQTLDPFKSLDETYNGIHATYPERDQNWEMNDAPPRYYPAFEALDDNRRLVADAQFVFVPFKYQVQRLMHAMIQDSRRMIIHQITLPSWAYALEPNDVISWTSARNGYTAKKFLIVGMTGAPTYDQLLQVVEIDPSDYDWDTDLELEAPLGYVGPIAIPVQEVTGFQVFPSTFADAGGTDRRPTIEVRMDGDLDDVVSVQIQVRLEATHDLVFDVTLPYGDPEQNSNPKSVVLNGTFLPNTEYEVRCKLIPITPRETDWSAWLPVTTPDVRFGPDDLYPIDVGDLVEDLEEWQKWMGNAVADIREELDALDATNASNALDQYALIQQVRTEMALTYDDITAAYTEQITIAVGPNSAIASQIEAVEVSVEGKADIAALQSIGVVVTDVNGEISGLGTAITGIQAQIDGVSANSTFRAQAGYVPGAGYTARIGLEARISSAATFRAAGLYMDITTTQARIVLSADQVAILAGGTVAALFDAGTAYIQTARIRNLTAVNIQAKSLNADVVLQDGTAITDLLAFSAVTSKGQFSGSVSTGASSYTTFASLAIANPNPNPVLIDVTLACSITQQGSGGAATISVRVINVNTGSVVASTSASSSSGTPASASLQRFVIDMTPSGAGTYTYALQRVTTGLSSFRSASGTVKMVWWKR